MSKFAKKEGHLVVDLDSKSPKLAVVGQKDSKGSSKKILAKAGVKEEKPAKKGKAVKVKAEPKSKEADTRKIKLLTKENPKREGSESFKRFELYRKSKTVADFIAAGGTAGDVRYDANAGYIEVA